MNISKVASSSTAAVNSNSHSVVGALQNQKAELSKQIQTVRAGNGDSKSKDERIKAINEQLTELDKQIQQAKIEEQQKELEKIQQKNAEKAEQEKYEKADGAEKAGVVLSASLNKLLAANNDQSTLKDMSKVRTELMGEKRVAESTIKHSKGDVRYLMGVVAKSGDHLSQLEDKMGKKNQQIQTHIARAVKIGINEAEREHTNKQDQVRGKEQDDKNVNNGDEQQVDKIIAPIDIGNVIGTLENEIDKDTEKKDKSIKPIDILA